MSERMYRFGEVCLPLRKLKALRARHGGGGHAKGRSWLGEGTGGALVGRGEDGDFESEWDMLALQHDALHGTRELLGHQKAFLAGIGELNGTGTGGDTAELERRLHGVEKSIRQNRAAMTRLVMMAS